MSGQIAALVGKRILKESARNHFGQEDPYFEQVPASRLHRAFGKKTQKRRKAVPPGLSDNDEKVLTKVKRRAYRLDYSLFNLCGIRFGWSSVIGLVPFAGDIGDAALAVMVVDTCRKIDGGLPQRLHMMMMINVLIDFVIGLVPFIGDLADAVYKCNTRNAVILEKHLREKGAKNIAKQQRLPDGQAVDMSLPEEFDKFEDGPLGDPPTYAEAPSSSTRPANRDDRANSPQQPKAARNPDRSRSWFGGRKQATGDLEEGVRQP